MDGQGPRYGPLQGIFRKLVLAAAILFAPALLVAQTATDTQTAAAAKTASDAQTTGDADPGVTQPTALAVPTREAVDGLLLEIRDDATLDETIRQTTNQSLQVVVDRLQQIEALQQSRAALAKSATDAADSMRSVKASLDQPVERSPSKVPAWRPLEEVRAAKAEADTDLASAREARVKLESKIRDRDSRRAELESIILSKSGELKELESAPATQPIENEDPRLAQAKRWDTATQLATAREQLLTFQQEQQTYAAEAELLPAQLALAKRDVATKELVSQELAAAVAQRRDTQVSDSLSAYRRAVGTSRDGPAVGILALAERWLEIVRASAQLQQTQADVKGRADSLRKDFADRKAEVENDLKNGGSLRSSLGLKLQRLRSQLPTVRVLRRDIADVQREIDSTQVLQAEIDARMEELTGDGLFQSQFDSTKTQPSELVQQELQLLRQMQTDVGEYWNDLIELKALREDLSNTVTDFGVLIDRNVLWIRSAQPYEFSDLPLAWQAFQELVDPRNVRRLMAAIRSEALSRPDIWSLWAVAVALLFTLSAKMRRRLAVRGEEASRRGQTKMQSTWAALLLTVALSLPFALLLVIPGWRLSGASGATSYVQAIGHALMETAAFILPLELLRQICRRDGLAKSHFNWPDETIRPLRLHLRFSLDLGVPLVAVWAATQVIGSARVEASLGRLMFASLMLLFTVVLWSVLHPRRGLLSSWLIKHPGGWIDRLKILWRPAIVSVPVLLGVVCLSGYSYSTRALSIQFYVTLWLMIGLIVTAGLLKRWALINRRRMLMLKAQQRAAEREKSEGTTPAFVDDLELDVGQINTQTQRLIYASLIVVGVLGVAWIWTSVLPAVDYLERITLIPGEDGEPALLTLKNLVLVLPIVVLTFITSRNLPGLLESVVLQRLPLDSAARYAITSLTSYALIMIGVMLSAKSLGLRWESIQWLVAALGVGLGFGLQEIFANFISGLILLFEQPIRVGDVVTLGDTTGIVSRIRIRATTVTNWDRQELIIPNKDLITGRLINWTLSDSTNRIVINVGIAYGTDTRKACSVLEQICHDHTNIAEDPPPIVTFEGFGDSTLNLVLRCFMSSLDGRLKTIHELYTTINDRFAEANLEIAFPQRDLHLRSLPPEMLDVLANRKSAA